MVRHATITDARRVGERTTRQSKIRSVERDYRSGTVNDRSCKGRRLRHHLNCEKVGSVDFRRAESRVISAAGGFLQADLCGFGQLPATASDPP
jgi:hypothetical protein